MTDGEKRRVLTQVNGQTQLQLIYGEDIRPIAAKDSNGIVSHFVYASQSHSPDFMTKGSTEYYFVKDHLGSIRIVVNSATGQIAQQLSYDEFGNVLQDINTGFQPFGFAGGIYDANTGLVRFGARDYDPETGRWTSKDPVLFNGGDTNLFGYVANDPVNGIDPSGFYEVCTRPLNGFEGEHGPLFHQYLCANGVCGGQGPSGSGNGSPGHDTNDPAPGSTGVSCKEGPKDNKQCMDKCIADAIGGSRPYYRWHNIGGTNCQKWASDTVSGCAAQCGGK